MYILLLTKFEELIESFSAEVENKDKPVLNNDG
jgi:hypothetical protein